MKGKEQHNTGVTSELFVAYKLSSKGFKVYFPFMTQSKADIVVEDKLGNFIKIQVKTATKSSANGNYFVQVRLGGCGRTMYTEGDFDYLAMVYENRIWMLPWDIVKDKKSMSFSIFSDRKGCKKPRNISMYEVI